MFPSTHKRQGVDRRSTLLFLDGNNLNLQAVSVSVGENLTKRQISNFFGTRPVGLSTFPFQVGCQNRLAAKTRGWKPSPHFAHKNVLIPKILQRLQS